MCSNKQYSISGSAPEEAELDKLDRQELQAEVLRLRAAIRQHRNEQMHNRCWLDDQRLYRALPEKDDGDQRLPDRAAFLANCERYWRTRSVSDASLGGRSSASEPRDHGPSVGVVHLCQPQPSDLAAVVALDRTLWGGWANSAPLYRQLFDLTPDTIVLAKSAANGLLGAAVGLIGSSIEDGWLLSIDVDPRFRGHGVGGALVEELLGRFRSIGTRSVYAVVDPANTPSRRMLEGLGFVEHLREPDYFNDGKEQIKYCMSVTTQLKLPRSR
jgi:ribosomal protein S18 acetylase RimI-like enzyme